MAWRWLNSLLGRGTHSCPECQAKLAAQVTHCEVCGYDLVERTKGDIGKLRGAS